MLIDPEKEWEELYKKKEKELEQVKKTHESYDAVKNERDQLQQKFEKFQAIFKNLGLTEQPTPEQVSEKLNELNASKKDTSKKLLESYKSLLERSIEEFEDLKGKISSKETTYQSEQENLRAQIEQVNNWGKK